MGDNFWLATMIVSGLLILVYLWCLGKESEDNIWLDMIVEADMKARAVAGPSTKEASEDGKPWRCAYCRMVNESGNYCEYCGGGKDGLP